MSSKTVLIIEQDGNIARQMTETLAEMGYEALIKEDGVSGLQAAKDILPDAIVLCVEVPKMSGFAVCHKIKKINELQNIPLLLTSAEATDESFSKHKELKTRADSYLIKPYDMTQFRKEFEVMMNLSVDQDPMSDAEGFDAILQDMDEHLDSEISASLDNLIDSSFFEQAADAIPEPEREFLPSAEIIAIDDESAEEELFTMESNGAPAKPVQMSEADWADEPTPVEPVVEEPAPMVEESAPVVEEPAPVVEEPAPVVEEVPEAPGTPAVRMETPESSLSASLGLDEIAESVPSYDAATLAELENLKKEKERLTRELAQAKSGNTSSFSKEKEFLNLRETINQKERAIIDLREEVDNKEQEVLKKKNRIRELEREIADLNTNGLELERKSVELGEELAQANARIAELDAQVADLTGQVQNLTADVARLKAELSNLEAAKKAVEAEYADTVARMKSEHEGQVTKLNGDHENAITTLKSEHATLSAALKSAHEGEVAGLHADYKGQLEEKQATHEQEMASTLEAHATALAEAAALLENTVNELKALHAGEIAGLNEKHAGEMATLRAEHATAMSSLQEAHQQATEAESARHAQEIADLNAAHLAATEQLQAEHEAEIARLKAEHEAATAAATTRHGQELAALVRQHQEQTANAKAAHEGEVANLKSGHEAATAAAAAAAAEVLAGTIADFEQKIDGLNAAAAAEQARLNGIITDLTGQKEGLEEKVFNLEQVRMQNEAAIDDLTTQVADLTDQLNAANGKIAADAQQVREVLEQMKQLAASLNQQFLST